MPNESQYCIQVVDDEEPLLNALRGQLVEAGYDVCTASGHDDAINQYKSGKIPDLSIIDIYFDGEPKGLEVLKYIKTNHPSSKVIMATVN